MFTKRHYEQIAETIRQTKSGRTGDALVVNAVNGVREVIARDLADLFAEDNPRFNRDLFLKACEVK